jgi:hypothetical protein
MSGMDLLEFGCIMTAIILAGVLIFVKMSTANALIMQDLAEKRRISEIKSKAAMARYQQDTEPEFAPWVGELLSSFGVSPEVLFADEMPPELVKLMPAIQAFLKSGGLQKLIGQIAGSQQPSGGEETSKGYI